MRNPYVARGGSSNAAAVKGGPGGGGGGGEGEGAAGRPKPKPQAQAQAQPKPKPKPKPKPRPKSATGGGGRGAPPAYQYHEVVRGRERRRALPGHECEQCEAFYAALCRGGKEDEAPFDRAQLIADCSRHRCGHDPTNLTPDGFWELSFADEREGYGEGVERDRRRG